MMAKKKTDYERGFIDALNALEHMANTDLINPPMTASDDCLNRGVSMVLYGIDMLRNSMLEITYPSGGRF
jgi:hypothetical protein